MIEFDFLGLDGFKKPSGHHDNHFNDITPQDSSGSLSSPRMVNGVSFYNQFL